jgi:acyl-CoA thioesterase-1
MKTRLKNTSLFFLVFIITIIPLVHAKELKTVLFLGDSLTEGYGIDHEKSYPFLFKKIVKEKKKIEIKVINGGVSGSTTASGMARLRWFKRANPDIMLLALGANDGLRGIKIDASRSNLEKIIKKAEELKIKVVLAGMLLPVNYGENYRSEFEVMFKSLAKKYKLTLIPFLLEGIAAKKELNISDGIHPNEKGHEIMAKTVYKYLGPLL